jgi:YHS domain-containing protein
MVKSVILALVLSLFLAGPVPAAADAPKTQAACVVMGGKVNKDVYVDYKGQRVYFCCPSCIEVFKKDPEKYLQMLKEQGIAPEKAPAAK